LFAGCLTGDVEMKLRDFALSFLFASALVNVGTVAHAQAWAVTDKGVTYKPLSNLTTDGIPIQHYSLIFGTTGYTGPAGAFPQPVNMTAWQGKIVGDSLVSAPTRSDGILSKSTTGNGVSSGCGSSILMFSCAEAANDGVLSVDSGRPVLNYATVPNARSSSNSPVGAHVRASLAVGTRGGAGSGTTSITLIPEPKLYAMMLAGLGLMGFVAQRRQQGAAG
jgi:hypothetical protein